MKVLILTAMYPTPENPAFGSFVRSQAESLKRAGVLVEVERFHPSTGGVNGLVVSRRTVET